MMSEKKTFQRGGGRALPFFFSFPPYLRVVPQPASAQVEQRQGDEPRQRPRHAQSRVAREPQLDQIRQRAEHGARQRRVPVRAQAVAAEVERGQRGGERGERRQCGARLLGAPGLSGAGGAGAQEQVPLQLRDREAPQPRQRARQRREPGVRDREPRQSRQRGDPLRDRAHAARREREVAQPGQREQRRAEAVEEGPARAQQAAAAVGGARGLEGQGRELRREVAEGRLAQGALALSDGEGPERRRARRARRARARGRRRGGRGGERRAGAGAGAGLAVVVVVVVVGILSLRRQRPFSGRRRGSGGGAGKRVPRERPRCVSEQMQLPEAPVEPAAAAAAAPGSPSFFFLGGGRGREEEAPGLRGEDGVGGGEAAAFFVFFVSRKCEETEKEEEKFKKTQNFRTHRTAPFLIRSHLHSACGSSFSLASGSPLPPSALPPPRDLARFSSCTRGLAGGVEPRPMSEAVRSLLEPRRPLPLLRCDEG